MPVAPHRPILPARPASRCADRADVRRRAALWLSLALIAAGLSALAPRPVAAQEALPDTLLVLDMSNSMWGQIDGRANVEIAREALAGLAGSLAAGTPTGLMAYGHRRTGDCGDVELVLPVTPLDPAALARAAEAMVPRGKTPITEALRQGAALLGENDRPGRLVLVSDGIETCGGDPCALARELAASGIAFTAHVIGFDIATSADQASIACIASATGGRYHNARNASELAQALAASTAAVETPVDVRGVRLQAVEAETGRAVAGPVDWTILSARDETVVASLAGNAAETELAPGDYLATASAGERAGGAAFRVADGAVEVTVPLSADLPEASVTPAAASVPAASSVSVAFTGPAATSDFLRIVPAGGERLETDLYAWVRDGNPLTLRVPSEPGAYEVVYVWAEAGERVLARSALAVTPAELALEVAAEVPAGTLTEVAWRGPGGEGDYLAFVPPGGAAGDADGRYAYVRDGSPLAMQAPAEPGAFEAIYVSGADGGVLHRQAFRVVEAPATLAVSGRAEAGGMIDVAWTGPAGPGDWIGIAPAGAPAGEYMAWTGTEGGSVQLQLPGEPGAYEVRYVLSAREGPKVLASVPIVVAEPVVRLEAPGEVAAGGEITVRVEGPAAPANWIGFARPGDEAGAYIGGAWTGADSVADGRVTLTAPAEPGRYELRFIIAAGEARVAASVPDTVK